MLFQQRPIRNIWNDTCKHAFTIEPELADGQIHWERAAVLSETGKLSPDPDDPSVSRGQISREIPDVLGPIVLGHQHLDIAPDHLVVGASEDILSRQVEGPDGSGFFDRSDSVQHVVEQGLQQALTVARGISVGFKPAFQLGDP
jgi:hypothetical protein